MTMTKLNTYAAINPYYLERKHYQPRVRMGFFYKPCPYGDAVSGSMNVPEKKD